MSNESSVLDLEPTIPLSPENSLKNKKSPLKDSLKSINRDDEKVDIKENRLLEFDESIMAILLLDMTRTSETKKDTNILWATDNYEDKGKSFQKWDSIEIKDVTGENDGVIKPRVEKSKEVAKQRSKDYAEIFTPSWICNKQNNQIDNSWFGKENIFNKEGDKSWKTNKSKITFPEGKTWQDYVKEKRLEITCGEAPYLASRYDTTNGEVIKVNDRIGLLDRKLRVVNENCDELNQWYQWAKKAFQSIYGYEFQGDNVLLARENLLYTFIDYYRDKWKSDPAQEILEEIAKIISWNIWQMDGLKYVVPNSCTSEVEEKITLFSVETQVQECKGCRTENIFEHTGKYCKVMDWDENEKVDFKDLIEPDKSDNYTLF